MKTQITKVSVLLGLTLVMSAGTLQGQATRDLGVGNWPQRQHLVESRVASSVPRNHLQVRALW